jgi:hypothetical protein
MYTQNIQAAADLETQMEEKIKDKLANAHHPPPSMQKKVLCPCKEVPRVSKDATSKILSQTK